MTIKQLFEQMTAEEIASFCKNVMETRSIEELFSNEYESVYDWLTCAFIWKETEQGHDYWLSIAVREIMEEVAI